MRGSRQQRAPLERALGAILAERGDVEGEPRTALRAVPGVQQERRRDLIVARASGVQPFAGSPGIAAHACIDRAMHVFKGVLRRPGREAAVVDVGLHAIQRRP